MTFRRLVICAALLSTVVTAGGAAASITDDVTKYAAAPAFLAPGPAFDAKKASGKSVFIVPAGNQVADLSSMSALVHGITQAGAAVGVKSTTCSNGGTVTEWTACLKRAIVRKANAVVLVGSVDLVALQGPLAEVRQAKIPVIAAHVLDPLDFASGVDSLYKQALSGLTATVPAPYAEAARLMADYVIATANGAGARIVVVGASDFPQSAPMVAAVQNEFTNMCGTACALAALDVPHARWQTHTIAAVQRVTLAKPTQYLIALFDGISGLAAEGEAAARAASAVAVRPDICGFGGDPSAIQQGQAGNRVVCNVAENMSWTGWATMDQTLRVLTGTRPVASENLPLRLWSGSALWPTSSWFSGGMTFPPVVDAGWGDPATTYVGGYRKLWGLP